MTMSNYLAAAILDAVFQGKAFTFEKLWLALHWSNPTPEGALSSEVAGGSYRRQYTGDVGMWSPGSNSTTVLTRSVTFAGMPSGVVRYVALWNAATSGTGTGVMMWYGPLDKAYTVLDGQTFLLPTNSVAVSLS